jgi:hypothetical protein
VQSLDEIATGLQQNGFDIEHAVVRPSKPRVTNISGPAVPSGADYAEIVAVRL